MKKRLFLAPVAVLAASLMSEQATANVDEKPDISTEISMRLDVARTAVVSSEGSDPFSFVLKSPIHGDVMAYHTSHFSHSSHSSHSSHYSGY